MTLTILRLLSRILTALTVRSELALENLALRQRLAILHRQHRRSLGLALFQETFLRDRMEGAACSGSSCSSLQTQDQAEGEAA